MAVVAYSRPETALRRTDEAMAVPLLYSSSHSVRYGSTEEPWNGKLFRS